MAATRMAFTLYNDGRRRLTTPQLGNDILHYSIFAHDRKVALYLRNPQRAVSKLVDRRDTGGES
jgi:hypothetical protein